MMLDVPEIDRFSDSVEFVDPVGMWGFAEGTGGGEVGAVILFQVRTWMVMAA